MAGIAPEIRYARSDDDVAVAFASLGSGPPLVMPGCGPIETIEQTFAFEPARKWIDALAQERTVVRFDLRGAGLSSDDAGGFDFSFETYCRDLDAVIRVGGLEGVTLLAAGGLGTYAIGYAAAHPDVIERVIVINPSRVVNAEGPSIVGALADMAETDFAVALDAALRHFLGSHEERRDEYQRIVAAELNSESFRSAATEAGANVYDPAEAASTLQAPVLVLRRVDFASTVGGGERALADLLPNASYVELPGDGLFPAEPGRLGGLQTIMFTDITGSTSMQQRLGDAGYQEALRAHDRSVRTAVREFAGREIKHTGDGIMAAFASAVRAVEAGRAIQRQLAEYSREHPDEALHVRIGLNAGEPIAEGDDLFGIAVTLASRIGDHAAPGQVLVSEVVRQLSAGKGFDFQSIGEARLKGFDESMRLYALESPEPSPVRGISTLPTFATTFVGRERELAELQELCSSATARLLTVFGPGGMGKTRLAVEAARSVVNQMRDGVVSVPLQSVTDPDAVPLAVAKAVDFAAGAAGDPTEQLGAFLSDREMLLVLDNFEQVVAAAPTVSAILEAAPRVRCLVTSREVLNLREEWLFPLEGMRLPEGDSAEDLSSVPAAQLFIERAQQVRHDFDAEADAESLLRICQLVEGLPLGIELAASWTRYMDTAAIVEEIERSIDFLESTLRNVPERHRQIRAVFDQS